METWFIFPIITAFLFSTVNYLDKFIIEKVSGNRGIGALVIFSALAGIPVVILLSILLPQEVLNISAKNAIIITFAGISYLISVIFYLHAMWEEEVSSIVPQMLLIPVITIILGYLFLNETILTSQILGGGLILSGAMVLTNNFKANSKQKIRIFLMILGVSFFASLNQLIFKYGITEEVSFWTALYWEHIGFILTALVIFIFIPHWRRNFFRILKKHGHFAFWTNTAGEITNIVANTSLHYAAVLAPVGLVALVSEGIQPFILLTMGMLITKFHPHIIKEDITNTKIITKSVAVLLMVLGLYIINI